MEIAVISDSISSIAYSAQPSTFSNSLLNRPTNILTLSDTSPDQSCPPFHVSAASPPPTKTLTRRRLRKSRRVRSKILNDDHGEEIGFFGFYDGGDFNGSYGSGGGGKGWSNGWSGGSDWGEFPDNSVSDPAFDVVYEVLCWIAMSNCLHFAVKKVVRFVADGFGGEREKIPMRLTPVC